MTENAKEFSDFSTVCSNYFPSFFGTITTSHIEGKKLYEGEPQDHENGTTAWAIFDSVLIRGVLVHPMFHQNEAGLRQLVSQFVNCKIIAAENLANKEY